MANGRESIAPIDLRYRGLRLRLGKKLFLAPISLSLMPEHSAGTETRDQRYDPQRIEQKWSSRWQQQPELFRAEPFDSPRPKYYVLEMLPYPSGALHMGHVRNYAIGDALARYMWMKRLQRAAPHGLGRLRPARRERRHQEQHAAPREWTLSNIAHMKAQMTRLGFAYDWSKEVTTCLPDYYRWNQWFFLKMLRARAGLSQEEPRELVSGVRHRAGQ